MKATVSTVYDGTDRCRLSTTASHRDHFRLGAEIAPTNLVEVTVGIADFQGRVKPRVTWTPAGGYHSGFWDSKLGTDCIARRLADGTDRCVPRDSRFGGYFADDQCMRPVGPISSADCMPPVTLVPVPDTCPSRYRVFSHTPEIHRGGVYRPSTSTGECRPVTLYDSNGQVTSFRILGPELGPSEFVEILPPAP